jgi:hypothetical protein
MPPNSNPAIESFVAGLGAETIWAEILVQRTANGFLLRNAADRDTAPEQLKVLDLPALRKMATFTTEGQFRPLRSSPDLPGGWKFVCESAAELWSALQQIYPGSVADWFVARSENPPVTHYRDFTNRQSGMYRATQLLTDEQAAIVTRAACHRRFCLKRRLWTVPGLAPETPSDKSSIPCLEPCAILLELARKSARIEQEEKVDVPLSRSELESLLGATLIVIEGRSERERIGDIAAPVNPRRLQLLLEKFKKLLDEKPKQAET